MIMIVKRMVVLVKGRDELPLLIHNIALVGFRSLNLTHFFVDINPLSYSDIFHNLSTSVIVP
jgi:hypothetical protein